MRIDFTRLKDPRIITAIVSLTIVLLVVGAVVSSSPVACGLCHSEQDDGLAASAHASVACYDCHLANGYWSLPQVKSRELFVMLPSYLVGKRDAVVGTRIARGACTQCHDLGSAVPTEAQGLRIIHAVCARAPERCDTCHSDTAHGETTRWIRQPIMDDCTACHTSQNASLECDSCHAGKLADDRLATGPWRVTHGPNWERMHGMGDLQSCAACHPAEKCVECHNTVLPHPVNYVTIHGAEATSEDAKCADCHKSENFCRDCHGMEMPHPDEFLPTHAEAAGPTIEENEANCSRCHREHDCINCHTRHTHPGRTDGNLGDRLPELEGGED